MGQDGIVARRYARGLAEYAVEAGDVERVRHDIRFLADTVDSRSGERYVPEFAAFLSSPGLDEADKLKAAAAVTDKLGVGKTVADFFALLIRHRRVELLPAISRELMDIAAELTGEHTAVVHTARPLTEDQSERLSRVLGGVFGGTVRLQQQIEPGLLAGAKITVGDKTFDGSVLGKLERLKYRLMTRSAEDVPEPQPEPSGAE